MREPLCDNCPDHEACMTGYPCSIVKRVHRSKVLDMSNCGECGGPVVKCNYCHHCHCDDETCPAMPIECAREGAS